MNIKYVKAKPEDAPLLALLNKSLIEDEGHRNKMNVAELAERMKNWLSDEYQAVYAKEDGAILAYALFKNEPDHIYLRQLFVEKGRRKQGYGRKMVEWLEKNVWKGKKLRIEVLVGNETGIRFWKAIGFKEYCLTMEK